MVKIMKLLIMIVTFLMTDSCAMLRLQSNVKEDVNKPIGAVLETTSERSCSMILLADGTTSSQLFLKAEGSERFSSMGVTVMKVTENGQHGNVSQIELSQLIGQARLVRMRSWCVIVVLVSHDPAFLAAFAESSLKGRLLVWATRLLVVTSLTLPQLYSLLPSHWTFSMMNTIFINLDEDASSNLRYSMYTYLPYSPDGAQVVRLAIWSPKHGMAHLTSFSVFPEKFSSFHGAKINVTALPWPPYWDEEEEEAPDGTVVKKYSGSDYHILLALAETLNFSISFLPISTWAEASKCVSERKAFITAVNHFILPERMKVYDFSHAYEFLRVSFSLAKPDIKPRWQSLYYPLTDQVWGAILAILIIMPAFFYLVSIKVDLQQEKMSVWTMVLEVMGMLVGQNLPLRFPDFSSSRLLVAAWLVFSFIIGVAYRGNLTAALTLPKFPPRPETIEQLVSTVDRVTVPPVGKEWIKFLSVSESEAFRKLAELMLPGPTIQEGLLMATRQNTAQVTDRRNMAHTIAKHFTKVDGSSQLYLGREPIFPVPTALPILHDAPFKTQLDKHLMAVVESGHLKKWVDDKLRDTSRKSQRREQEKLSKKPQKAKEDKGESDSNIKALTLTHMQGPLMLLLLGLLFAGIIYIGEIFVIKCRK